MKKSLIVLFCVVLTTSLFSQNLSISTTEWPVIHQNNLGTKESTNTGPVGQNILSEKYLGNKPVLMLQGNQYLYYQASQSPYLYAFDPNNIQSGPVFQKYTGAWFPDMGGGMIDNLGNNWWNISGRLIRFNEILSTSDSSELFVIENGGQIPPANGITLLTPNRLMVSTVSNYAWVFNSELDSISNKFKLLDTINFKNFTFTGDSIWKDELIFSPRPIIDDSGYVYLVGGDWLVKLLFNQQTNKLNREIVWAYKNPNDSISDFTLSNPIIINNNICVTASASSTSHEKLYILNKVNGNLVYDITPFPSALGKDALHTLGGIQSSNIIFAICNSPDGDAGVSAYDLNTGLEKWPFVSLKNISEAFCISSSSNKVFLSYSEDAFSAFKIASIDINTGQYSDIYIDSSITVNPTGHLGLIGYTGLIYPTPTGIVRLFDGPLNIFELEESKNKIFKIVDVLGRETTPKNNQILFYIYEDGTIEKRIVIE
jgi:hypothetical protein